jgi:hypothetical protein
MFESDGVFDEVAASRETGIDDPDASLEPQLESEANPSMIAQTIGEMGPWMFRIGMSLCECEDEDEDLGLARRSRAYPLSLGIAKLVQWPR